MRPIDKGPAPADYEVYQNALDDLEQRLGRYCSYCERRFPASLEVEHMSPKSRHPDQALDWGNFLLGCRNCNAVKGFTDLPDGTTLWPDEHNTFLAITYERGGFVRVSSALPRHLMGRARALIDLVGLDRHADDEFPDPARRDRRWLQREEAWAVAEKCRANYERLGQAEDALHLVLVAAQSSGFFSVWLAVFVGHPAVKRALIERLEGTAARCFDSQGQPVPRTALGV